MNLTLIDFIIITIVVYHAYKGLKYGFFRLLFETLGAIGGLILAIRQYNTLAQTISTLIGSPIEITAFISFILIWALSYALAILLSRALTQTVKLVGFNPLNRMSGLAMGILNSLVYILPIFLILTQISPESVSDAYFTPPLHALLNLIIEK